MLRASGESAVVERLRGHRFCFLSTVISEAGAFPRSGYDAPHELSASNAGWHFRCVTMSIDYPLMHKMDSKYLRPASNAS